MEHKMQAADGLKFIESVDSPNGEFSTYASTFANWDMVGERPVKGAFTPHLADFLKDGFIALGHSWDNLPIAYPLEAYEDEHGLYLRAAFHSTPEAQKARTVLMERLAQGKSAKTSIGYSVIKDEQTDEGRLLKEIKLMEVSIVNVPANPLANILASKAAVSALPLELHSETVVSAVEELKGRFVANHAARLKEGRVLSDKNRKRIMALIEELQALMSESEPKGDPEKHLAEVERLRADWLRINAQRLPNFGD
jgi:HK97 family phage prohead protease